MGTVYILAAHGAASATALAASRDRFMLFFGVMTACHGLIYALWPGHGLRSLDRDLEYALVPLEAAFFSLYRTVLQPTRCVHSKRFV